MGTYGEYKPKEMSPLESLRDQAGFWCGSGRKLQSRRNENDSEKVKTCYEKVLVIYRKIQQEFQSVRSQMDLYGGLKAYMELCLQIGTRDSMQQDKLLMEEALEVIESCLPQMPGDRQMIHKQVDTLQLLGGICRDLGGSENLKEARHNYEMARRIWSVVDQRGGPVHYSIAHIRVLYRMGMLSGTAKEKAWQYLTQAAEIAELVSTAKGFAQWRQYSQLLLRLRNRL